MNIRFCILLIALVVLVHPSHVRGNEFCITPSVAIQQQYNSNILLDTDDVQTTGFEESDFITILSAGFEMTNRTERLDSNLLARLDRLEYLDNRDLSDTDQLYNGSLRYRVTPLFSISARAGYKKKTNPAIDYGMPFEIPPGTIIFPPPIKPPTPPGPPGDGDGGGPGTPGDGDGSGPGTSLSGEPFPVINEPRNTITGAFSADFQVTEKALTSVSYTYDNNYYSDDRYEDDEAHDVRAGLEYDLGKHLPLVKGRVHLGYSLYHFSDSQDDTIYGGLGFTRALNELWSISVDGGIRHTSSDITTTECVPLNPPDPLPCRVVEKDLTDDNWDWLGGLALTYGAEYFSTSLSYSRSFAVASGLNAAAVRDTFALSFRYRFTYKLSAILTTGYNTYEPDDESESVSAIDQENLFINPGLRYEFTRNTALEASYGYAWVSNCAESGSRACSDEDADRHLVSVRFSMQHPFCK